MADFAELELRIKSLEAVLAKKSLDELEKAARRAERAARIDFRIKSVEINQASLRLDLLAKQTRDAERALRDQERQADRTARSIARLNSQLQFVSRSLTGFFGAFLAYR